MDQSFTTTLTIEGNPCRVRVHYETSFSGDITITHVSEGATLVTHLLMPGQFKLIREEAARHLSTHSVHRYRGHLMRVFKPAAGRVV